MTQSRYTPAEFVGLIKANMGKKKVDKVQEAMLYGMALGRLATVNRTDGKISHKQAEKLIAVYNDHLNTEKRKVN